jgi:hypothetical protein
MAEISLPVPEDVKLKATQTERAYNNRKFASNFTKAITKYLKADDSQIKRIRN